MLPKSKTLKRGSTKIVDVAGIDKRIFALPREVSVKKKTTTTEKSRGRPCGRTIMGNYSKPYFKDNHYT
ncbi:MAG: hypothetical protein ACI9V1_002644 [Spirosomataceae bacterium]|jgi:hypothetical protein